MRRAVALRAPDAGRERPVGQGWSEETRRLVSARSGGRCELGSCPELATDLHHRQRRREGRHGPSNALHLCRVHHSWVHGHPGQARAAGWIVSAFGDPAGVPVVVRGRLVWLSEDGGVGS
jgi:hypothetical protein